MRNFLYESVGRSCILFARASDGLSNIIVYLTVKILESLKVACAHFCMWLLSRIDSKRVANEKSVNEQIRVNAELALMAAAVHVKEAAEESGDWTEEHSEALNMIGVNLIHECNWEPVAVHRYFKPLVEAIEGLDYGDQ